MLFRVIGDKPKAHKNKIINFVEYTKTIGYNEHGEFIRLASKHPIEFAKESGYKQNYYCEVTEYGNGDMIIILYPIYGNKITLQVEIID